MTAIPTYDRAGCPRCAEWPDPLVTEKGTRVAVCGGCGEPMKFPTPPRGFQSVRPDHHHFKTVQGLQGLQVVHMTQCRDCYLKGYKEAYPDAKPPDFDAKLNY